LRKGTDLRFIIRWLLAPFSWLFGLVVTGRNYLYDSGYFASHTFDRFVISVGNLNVGGSGKTPLVEYLTTLLQPRRVATLSRGYGRKTRGFRQVTPDDTPATVGDEPLQFLHKFGRQVPVFVGEERALAIPEMLAREPEIEVIILDDAFQHRPVRPQFSVLVTDVQLPFFSDCLLPSGRLREPRRGARRADVVVVTRCTGIHPDQRKAYTLAIQQFAGPVPVLFAGIRYLPPVGFSNEVFAGLPVVAVTGIAKPQPFIEHLQQNFRVVRHFRFPDHHAFTRREVRQVGDFARAQAEPVAVITTEKDFTRLKAFYGDGSLERVPCFYIPICMEFLGEDGKVFDTLVLERFKSQFA
jgi:tetraacyldisaccharide 4'-kinase